MFISKIKMHNFRSFEGDHEIKLSKGINFFVGDNNAGKTTLFKAVEFIRGGKDANEWRTIGKESENVAVEVVFEGEDLEQLVTVSGLEIYAEYIYEDNGVKRLKLLRDSNSRAWTDGAYKTKYTTIKNSLVWHPGIRNCDKDHWDECITNGSALNDVCKKAKCVTSEWKNPSGIDKASGLLFDAQFVYSDLKNEDYQDFGKAKVIGKLISAVAGGFQETEEFTNLKAAHDVAFNSLTEILTETQRKLETLMDSQYGKTEVKFNFGLPELDSFLKNGQVMLSDNGVETDIGEKGTGMQRALALALIQLYADVIKNKENIEKPLLFFIDEPETFLHPKAQDKLIRSLVDISQDSQVFLTTHSPYLLKHFDSKSNQITIFSRGENRIKSKDSVRLLPFSPTWGEINYDAFGIVSVEFHNELYGYVEEYFNSRKKIPNPDFDRWKNNQGAEFTGNNFEKWQRFKGVSEEVEYIDDRKPDEVSVIPLPTFVRHRIHHPENTLNCEYTSEQLRKSTEILIELSHRLQVGE